ncbi:hypothetical protein COJ46_04155 [Bacillus sp. AFS077874]|uniref:hypothetical protein n=1 Tax=unclassified Bacillus (in: firmicutes) TaxID=185979 RepID=UPI000BEB5460|nr:MULTISPECIES: hypothetical protein [unclassified Bacillus (in: firmicutes)]PEC47746.1 hypothetical protein CON00_20265 [Bacillus sp. AFS096315]PFM83003.1 hypothetical protein COJ46_04155 [Bacillus sp. AFS077874]
MNFRSKEQILTEQPSIERKIEFRGNKYKLVDTVHDVSHGGFDDLTCYTYRNDTENVEILLYVQKGKIVIVEP